MTATPLAGTSAVQEAVRYCKAAAATHPNAHGRLSITFDPNDADAGRVPADVMPALHRLAGDLGYRVRTASTGSISEDRALGYTHGADEPGYADPENPPFMITLRPGMSPASEARVLLHELGHVILAHPPRTGKEAWGVYMARRLRRAITGSAEDLADECAVELAAGAVCRLAGIGTGLFTQAFCNERVSALDNPATEWAALLAARALWAAIRPGE
jgi:hypothetical protein